MNGRGRYLAAAVTLLAGLPATAWGQTTQNRVGGTATVTGGYSNNPFSEGDSGRSSSPLVTIDLAPTFQHLTERSVLSVFADASLQQYLRRYGRNDSYSGGVDYTLRPAERITAHLRLDLQSQILGSFNNYVPTVLPAVTSGSAATTTATTPAPVVDPSLLLPSTSPLITDVALYGLRNRRRSARLAGDASIGVTARDSVTLSASSEVARYGRTGGLVLGDYEDYGGTVGYQRRVSDYINVGLQGSASLFNYRSGLGNSRSYSLQATASGRLNPLWTFNGALGVSFIDGDDAGSTRATSLSGNVNACRRGQRSTMCAQVARQVSPTGIDGSQYVTTASLNWSKRLDERSSLSLNASYSKVGESGRLRVGLSGVPLETQYGQGSVGYSRQLRQRLNFVASANVRQLFGGSGNRAADFGGQAGLSYHFGDLR